MSTQIQSRRGTTAEHSTFTGASGELTVDTDKKVVVVHDGSTAGGFPMLAPGQLNPVLFPNQAAFPDAGANHGAIAHSHADGAMFFAHAGTWHRLGNANAIGSSAPSAPTLGDFWTDTSEDPTAPTLKTWNGSEWLECGGGDPIVAPIIGSVNLTEDSPGGAERFANQTFDINFNMFENGAPASQKYLKGEVTATYATFGETEPIDTLAQLGYQGISDDGWIDSMLTDKWSSGEAFAGQHYVDVDSDKLGLITLARDTTTTPPTSLLMYSDDGTWSTLQSYQPDANDELGKFTNPSIMYAGFSYHLNDPDRTYVWIGEATSKECIYYNSHAWTRHPGGMVVYSEALDRFIWSDTNDTDKIENGDVSLPDLAPGSHRIHVTVSSNPEDIATKAVTSAVIDGSNATAHGKLLAVGNGKVVILKKKGGAGMYRAYVWNENLSSLGGAPSEYDLPSNWSDVEALYFFNGYFWAVGYSESQGIARSYDGSSWATFTPAQISGESDSNNELKTWCLCADDYIDGRTWAVVEIKPNVGNKFFKLYATDTAGASWTGDEFGNWTVDPTTIGYIDDVNMAGGWFSAGHSGDTGPSNSKRGMITMQPRNKQLITFTGPQDGFVAGTFVKKNELDDKWKYNKITSQPSANQIIVEGPTMFSVGDTIRSVTPTGTEEVTSYLVVDSVLNVSDLSDTDPGFTGIGLELDHTLSFGATTGTGQSFDDELPEGTTLKVTGKAQTLGQPSVTKESNTITPISN